MSTASPRYSLALVGAGMHARLHHGPAIQALRGRIGRVCAADPSAASLEAFAAVCPLDARYADFGEMLDRERPDAVLVLTPPEVAGSQFRALAGRGLPLLMEKPLGATAAETEDLCRLARREGTRAMMSFNRRFAPVCRRALELMRTRFAGRPPEHVRGAMLRHGRYDAAFLPYTGIHLFDAMNYFAGGPALVKTRQYAARGGASHPALSALAKFLSGATGEIVLHTHCGHFVERYEIMGEGYHIDVDYPWRLTAYEEDREIERFAVAPDATVAEREGAVDELAHFLDRIGAPEAAFGAVPDDALAAAQVAAALLP